MSQDGDSQYIPYRDYFKVQLTPLRDDISGLKADIKELGREVATKRDFDVFRESLREKLSRIELEAYGLKESVDELEKTVRANEREIALYKRVSFSLVGIVISIIIALVSAWLKGVLGL